MKRFDFDLATLLKVEAEREEEELTQEKFTVRPGDIFRDKDPRMEGRHLKVESVSSRRAWVVNCAPDGGKGSGRKTVVSLRGLETRFERVGGSRQREDLERAVICAAEAWREASVRLQEADAAVTKAGGDDWKQLSRAAGDAWTDEQDKLAALRAAVDAMKGER